MNVQQLWYVVGIDFGTLSGRAVVVRADTGEEVATAEHVYAHAVMDLALPDGTPLPPDWALQHPQDYVDVLRTAVPAAVVASGVSPADIVGIGVAFTACTLVATSFDGTPLCLLPEFEDRPHAYVKLWRHHAAQGQADRINRLAGERGEPWLRRYGGRISSEWQFAKALQVFEEDPEIYARADRFIEATDWITWQLCGVETRNACTAGYKGIFQDGRYPSREFLEALTPGFGEFATSKLEHPLSPLGSRAGGLTEAAAAWTGLPTGIAVCVGNVDAHVTAPTAQAIEPGQLVAIMGTSTCHVMNGSTLVDVPGMCGVVDGGISPGRFGYEAGQSGVGDIFAWFVNNGVPASYRSEAAALGIGLHEHLTALGADQPVGAHGLVALDWHSGNRSVLVDHELSGLLVGQTLATTAPEIYRALLESTAFGTRKIIETFEAAGVPVTELVVAGGLLKNAVLMQIYADVTKRPLSLTGSAQGPALGAAMHAAVAAGVHFDIESASHAMGSVRRGVYQPDPQRAHEYDRLYRHYSALHDRFGDGAMMHDLRAIRNEARAGEHADARVAVSL